MTERMKEIKAAMKKAKETGQPQKVEVPTHPEKSEIKVNISLRLDNDLLQWIKSKADEVRMPYQSYINLILNSAMRSNADPMRIFMPFSNVVEVKEIVDDVVLRVEKLEKAKSGKAG